MKQVQFALRRSLAPAIIPAVAALLLAACETTPAPETTPTTTTTTPTKAAPAIKYTATPGLTPRDRLTKAFDLLNAGQAGQARAEVEAALVDQPDYERARKLLQQFDTDPLVLLGQQSFPYVLRQGDTISELAGRYLGDSLMFWALARYNNIAVPSRLEVGQTILIPGLPRPPRRAPATARPATPERPAAAAAPQAPARNPARARELRGSALELMSRGVVDGAVRLLEQALRLDPGNTLIINDLNRARRLLGAGRR